MAEYLILTDEKDQFVGMMEKMLVHQHGLLHRAFSVFIFNTKGEILLQQRAFDKYHSPGLWSNACCSHPRFEETIADAVERRLWEEMGIHSDTEFAFSFIYKAAFENGLTEHEYDHVYIPVVNRNEVNSWKYMRLSDLRPDIEANPANYSEWLKQCLPRVIDHFITHY
jgi:isopentenyl-diphosphate delta-isomerase